ncbi:MAG: hypothetical protein FWH33_09920, partial [Oscillospiraceae bacterium]|nr:hypothetical protein [Oscillospiraceae bacterium]
AMGWLLDRALEWIVAPVVEFILNTIWPFIYSAGQYILLVILILPFWIINLLEQAVNIFSGVQDISVTEGGVTRQMNILNYFFGQSVVTRVFWGITIIAAALCLGFSIIAVIRSMGDLDLRRPVGKVMGTVGKSMLTFLIIPFMCIAAINLASLVLKQTSYIVETGGLTGGEPVSTTGALFMVSATPETVNLYGSGSLPGEWEWSKDSKTFVYKPDNPVYNETTYTARYNILRAEYLSGRKSVSWNGIEQMRDDFNIYKLLYPGNYLITLISAWFYVIMLVMIMMVFISRIFELIVLYIVSPFFVSAMPLDEGVKFKAWREQFISKVVAGFGSIIMLKLFILLLPIIWNDGLRLHENGFTNTVLKALLMLGGIFATYKMHTMISKIVSERGAGSETTAAGFAGYALGSITGRGNSGTSGAITQAIANKVMGGKSSQGGGSGQATTSGGPPGGSSGGSSGSFSSGSGNANPNLGGGAGKSAQSASAGLGFGTSGASRSTGGQPPPSADGAPFVREGGLDGSSKTPSTTRPSTERPPVPSKPLPPTPSSASPPDGNKRY